MLTAYFFMCVWAVSITQTQLLPVLLRVEIYAEAGNICTPSFLHLGSQGNEGEVSSHTPNTQTVQMQKEDFMTVCSVSWSQASSPYALGRLESRLA